MKTTLAAQVLPLLVLLAGCSAPTGSDLDIVRGLSYLQPAAAPAFGPGQPVVVEFWATWCPPCVESTPHLVELDQRARSQGLVLIGVHSKRGSNEEAKIRAFVERYDVEYAIALDHDGAASAAYGVSGIPHAFVYDRAGTMIWRGHPLDPAFDSAVEQALGS